MQEQDKIVSLFFLIRLQVATLGASPQLQGAPYFAMFVMFIVQADFLLSAASVTSFADIMPAYNPVPASLQLIHDKSTNYTLLLCPS
ncbi:hypothetical protein OAG60_02615 [bacterium]|nr:hypothetical protein [bacterium]